MNLRQRPWANAQAMNTAKLRTMNIQTFNDLLVAARLQAEPQRLLLVFASASLPAAAPSEQQAQFAAGDSGELTPLMCVDKDPLAVRDFDTLLAEAAQLGPDWALVFAAALQGQAGLQPSPTQVEAALQRMVEAVKRGELGGLIPFDRRGDAVHLT